MTAITSLPALDRTSATFRDDLNTFFGTLLPAFAAQANLQASELNTLAATLSAIAAGTAMAIPYTFSTTTTDADPGAGFLRLNQSTQNTATVIRADLTGADGSTWTSVLDTFDDSTSTVKGHIMLQKLGDATKWILFSVSALASPTGYKNITVAVVAASAASPFADGDSLILKFTRNGDKGDTGATGSPGVSGGTILLATLTPTAAANVDALSAFTSSYDNYLVIGDGITVSPSDSLLLRFASGGVVDTGSNYINNVTTASAVSATSSFMNISGATSVYGGGRGVNFVLNITNANDSTNRIKGVVCNALLQSAVTPAYILSHNAGVYFAANAISGMRFYWSGGNSFGATGTIRIFGYNNT